MGECAKTDYRNRKWIRRGTGTGTFKCVSILELQSSLVLRKGLSSGLSRAAFRGLPAHVSLFQIYGDKGEGHRKSYRCEICGLACSWIHTSVPCIDLPFVTGRAQTSREAWFRTDCWSRLKTFGKGGVGTGLSSSSKVSNAWHLHWYLQKGSCFRRLGGGQENIRSLQLRFCRGGKE